MPCFVIKGSGIHTFLPVLLSWFMPVDDVGINCVSKNGDAKNRELTAIRMYIKWLIRVSFFYLPTMEQKATIKLSVLSITKSKLF